MAVILASSHCDGRIPSFIDLLYNIDNGWLNSLDNSLRKYGCQLSGPGDLPWSKLFNLFNTNSSVTCNVYKLSPANEYVISGILAKSSSTKILLKKLFSDSAFSLFETENVPLGLFNVGILALAFSFEWTYFQNCLGLCLLSAARLFSVALSMFLIRF